MKRVLCVLTAIGLAATSYAQETKDATPPSGGDAGVGQRATGGPDMFGYTFFDSAEAECPFEFVDITSTGTLVVSGDDVGAPAALGGSGFNFYGTNYDTLAATSNGYLSTDPTDMGPDLSNDCPLPATPSTGGGARIYPLHDDLISDVLYEYQAPCARAGDWGDPNEACHVFQWNNVTHFGGTATWSMQSILYETSGEIVNQIGAGNDETGTGSTTGIQNDGATDGLTYACDTDGSLPDNTGICFFDPGFGPGEGAMTLLEVPTASTYGMAILVGLLSLTALLVIRRSVA